MIDSYRDLKNERKILMVLISVITLVCTQPLCEILFILTGPTTNASKSLCSVPSIRVEFSNVSKLIYKEWLPTIMAA